MNDRAREVLRQAWLNGVPQIKGDFRRNVKTRAGRTEVGFCGLGVLGWRKLGVLGWRKLGVLGWRNKSDDMLLSMEWGLSVRPLPCPVCDMGFQDEVCLVVHLNDSHDFDFGKIAELCPGEEPL